MVASGYTFSDLQLKHIVKFADVDGNGVLDKWEFLAICAFVNVVQDVRRVFEEAFYFDWLSFSNCWLTDHLFAAFRCPQERR